MLFKLLIGLIPLDFAEDSSALHTAQFGGIRHQQLTWVGESDPPPFGGWLFPSSGTAADTGKGGLQMPQALSSVYFI